MNPTYEKLLALMNNKQKYEAITCAESINNVEGLYYGEDTTTVDVVERYFNYYVWDMSAEEYWHSSSATC